MSRTGDTKAELINRAYEELRISGLTKSPSTRDNTKALDTLENMAEEFQDRNICTGYNFEDEPSSGSLHNLHRKYWNDYSVCLAVRLISTFGKAAADKLDTQLLVREKAAFSNLSASTAVVRNILPPSRMPLGAGNTKRRFNRFRRFYPPVAQVPISCKSNSMVYDEIDDYVEHFDSYLNDGETISSYTITADTGLTIVSDSNTNTDVSYRIDADGNSETNSDTYLQVVITITTSDSRVKVRTINFEITEE